VVDHDAELCFTRFRCFGQDTGSWISTDPLEVAGGLNLYGFDGSPTRVVDPLGLDTHTGHAHPPTIATPYGDADQEQSPEALAAREQVEAGATLYRIGTTGRSKPGTETQFWALEDPRSPGYADRYGIPPENVANADYIETATIKPGTPFVTRQAPPVGTNRGGGIEVVVPSVGVDTAGPTPL
jgi:hypothetical protein